MFIVIHCGGMPFNGTTIRKKSLGGSETSAYYLARELVKRGHRVTIFTNEMEEGTYDGVKYVWMGNITEQDRMGDRFFAYIANTPVDVLIGQRAPDMFVGKYQSSVNLWWVHDLALYRSKDRVLSQMYNVDGVLTVSKYHKKQVKEVYDLTDNFIHVLHNGVDLDLYSKGKAEHIPEDQFNMIYSSRPERGLQNLVMPEGIMEKLLKEDENIHLYVCGYDNTTDHMRDLYEMLWERCNELPNVTNLGALTKPELAKVQNSMDLFCYPTEFEEVSCITAMEAMASHTPMLTSDVGALRETTTNVKTGTVLVKLHENKMADSGKFVRHILDLKNNTLKYVDLKKRQIAAASYYSYANAAKQLEDTVEAIFKEKMKNKATVARHLMNNSDVMRLKKYFKEEVTDKDLEKDNMLVNVKKELEECYHFADSEEAYYDHYQRYYEYEKSKTNVLFGPENLSNQSRYRVVRDLISRDGGAVNVLDYGCAHGHYTYNLARDIPEANVTGIDIASINIQYAKQNNDGRYEEKGFPALSNLSYYEGRVVEGTIESESEIALESFDVIVVAEVLEHVREPHKLLNTLNKYLKPDGYFIVTTPYGPWEMMGFEKEHPWRAHLWHFDRCEIFKMFGDLPKFTIKCIPDSHGPYFQMVGSYAYRFGKTEEEYKPVLEYVPDKKIAPRETISLCMITKNSESLIRDCIRRLKVAVDEIVIAIDKTTTDSTKAVIEKFRDECNLWPIVRIIETESPLEIGFDEARNKTLKEANGDWILWVDSDEKVHKAEYLHLHARYSQVQGFMVPQHHFAVEPAGLIKTDLPVRLFRNRKGIKFFGRVHEHPELGINKGVGMTVPAGQFSISHGGYETEAVRQARFSRNLPLLMRNREDYPDRTLDKLLLIRDLSQMCRFEVQQGFPISQEMMKRADRVIELFPQLVKENTRMAVDSLMYYSDMVKLKGIGFEAHCIIDVDKVNRPNGSSHDISGRYASKEHLDLMFNQITSEKVKHYEKKYF